MKISGFPKLLPSLKKITVGATVTLNCWTVAAQLSIGTRSIMTLPSNFSSASSSRIAPVRVLWSGSLYSLTPGRLNSTNTSDEGSSNRLVWKLLSSTTITLVTFLLVYLLTPRTPWRLPKAGSGKTFQGSRRPKKVSLGCNNCNSCNESLIPSSMPRSSATPLLSNARRNVRKTIN